MGKRCWGCCQENCGYTHCSCPCHPYEDTLPAPKAVEPLPQTAAELRRREAELDLNNRRILLANGHCQDHYRYEAKRRPRSACEWCWALWLRKKGIA